jgi:hypothetical protein
MIWFELVLGIVFSICWKRVAAIRKWNGVTALAKFVL